MNHVTLSGRCLGSPCGSVGSWSQWVVFLPGPSRCWHVYSCPPSLSSPATPPRSQCFCPSSPPWSEHANTHLKDRPVSHKQINLHESVLFHSGVLTLMNDPVSPVPSQSETLHINPLHTLIPATMCVSFGVMLPVGNPPNAIVFSYGHVQISDMVWNNIILLYHLCHGSQLCQECNVERPNH